MILRVIALACFAPGLIALLVSVYLVSFTKHGQQPTQNYVQLAAVILIAIGGVTWKLAQHRAKRT